MRASCWQLRGRQWGASRLLFERAPLHGRRLLCSPYVIAETESNLVKFPSEVTTEWQKLKPTLLVVPDVFTNPRPVVFSPAKDRPVLMTALAWADVLLTLDRNDFKGLLGRTVYGLLVLTPGDFLRRTHIRS